MKFPKFPLRKKKEKEFLLIEIGLENVNMAKLLLEDGPKITEVGRKSFSTLPEMFDASLEAIDELAGKTSNVPKKAILGVCGGPIKTETTVAQYIRPDPKEPINSDEIEKVLEEVSERREFGDFKLFFSTIASAEIDGTKVSNPIGIKGEKVSLSCFIAYKESEELSVFDKLIDEIDMELEKIIPTSFAVAKMMLKKGNENALLLRVGKVRSEVAFLSKGHIDEIIQFDLGASNPDLLMVGFEVTLEKLMKEANPELVWLYPDNQWVELAELKEKFLEFPWGNLGFDKAPHIEVAQGDPLTSPEDTGLKALSLEAMT